MDSTGGMAEVVANLNAMADRVEHNATVLLSAAGGRIANQAKQVAPWTDRTGNARRSIRSEDTSSDGVIRQSIGMGGDGLEYTKALEMGYGGRYRVIDPTVFGYGKVEMENALKDLINVG